ncbi:methyltransferase [Amycolatopsis sp. cg5]|uniref:methyltransferase n=1 Tax=Amycolatopsis sp. cg5 TaxID=3238802 RepID=UPI003525C8E6
MNDHVAKIRNLAGLATPMALRVAVTLGLPDRLCEGASASSVAAELRVSPVSLELLLGHLASLGIVERVAEGYRTTEFGATLRADAGNGLTNFLHLDMAGGRADLAFVELLHSVTTGESGYTHRFGKDFWTDLTEQPHLRASFDEQMTHRFRSQIPGLVAGFDWGRFTKLVDVGGGHGTLLAAILAAHGSLRGHLVDLDPTATEATRTFSLFEVQDRAQVTASSFFDPLPAGADAYLLCDILHDWDDANAHRILARCVEACTPASRVLVIEALGGRQDNTEFDLAMLAIFGGRERRLDEFHALASAHGLALETAVVLTEQRNLLEFRLA